MVPWGFNRLAEIGIGLGLFLVLRMLVPLAVVVLVVWLVVRALRTRPGQPGNSGREDPLNVLKVRYARGEISREEYDRLKEELKA